MTGTGERSEHTTQPSGGLVVLLACIFGPVIGSFCLGPVVLAVPFTLVFGWTFFGWRVLQLWTVNWVAVAAGVLSVVVLFIAGFAALGLTRAAQWLWALEKRPYVESVPMWRLPGQVIRTPRSSTVTMNCLKQMLLGVHTHAHYHKAQWPGPTFDRKGRALHAWQTMLLPYIEEVQLYRHIRQDVPWQDPHNLPWLRKRVGVYQSPYVHEVEIDGLSASHFAGNVHVLGGRPIQVKDFADGASNTLVMGEAAGEFLPWGKPGNVRDPGLGINRGAYTFGNPDPRIDHALFALADGSVRVVNENVNPRVLKALATPAGGEVVHDDEW
jgi:hypothetical protein